MCFQQNRVITIVELPSIFSKFVDFHHSLMKRAKAARSWFNMMPPNVILTTNRRSSLWSGASDIQSLKSFHGIGWVHGRVRLRALSGDSVFLAHGMLRQPSFLEHDGGSARFPAYGISSVVARTCSQIAVLLPNPSLLSFCGFAAATFMTRPYSSL